MCKNLVFPTQLLKYDRIFRLLVSLIQRQFLPFEACFQQEAGAIDGQAAVCAVLFGAPGDSGEGFEEGLVGVAGIAGDEFTHGSDLHSF